MASSMYILEMWSLILEAGRSICLLVYYLERVFLASWYLNTGLLPGASLVTQGKRGENMWESASHIIITGRRVHYVL